MMIKIKREKEREKKNGDEDEKEEKKKIKFNKNEIDFGYFHQSVSWSKNNEYLAYSKYHYANNNSRVYDLCLYDVTSEKKEWITNDLRATYPVFTPENEIIFVSHTNSTSNLYKIDMYGVKQKKQLTLT